MIVTLWPAKSIADELDENQFAKTHSGEAGGGKCRKSVSWTIGNGNFEATSGDADKLARALEGLLVEGKIKVRFLGGFRFEDWVIGARDTVNP